MPIEDGGTGRMAWERGGLVALAGALAELGVNSVEVQTTGAKVRWRARETDLPGELAKRMGQLEGDAPGTVIRVMFEVGGAEAEIVLMPGRMRWQGGTAEFDAAMRATCGGVPDLGE
ncbi:MAG: hypothetical protein AB7G11_05295 [Phycisphaerales bacterium]